MKYNFLYGISAIFLITMMFNPAYAGVGCTPLGHLDIESADLFENLSHISAKINVCDPIPPLVNGPGGSGAYGTGVLTSGTIIVTTTHPGVLDSETQGGDANSAIQHNHYVNLKNLGDPQSPTCVTAQATAEVDTISFESPGIAMWPTNMYKIWEVPKASPPGEYHNALTGDQMDFTVGSLTNLLPFADYTVVSFTLVPALQDPTPTVCVLVQEVFEAEINPLVKIAGELLNIDTTALVVSGISATAVWLLPVVISVVGIGAVIIRKKF